MQRRFVAAATVGFAAALAPPTESAIPAPPGVIVPRAKLTPNLAQDLATAAEQRTSADGRHRVIVSLKPGPALASDPRSMTSRRSMVAARQANFESLVASSATKRVIRRYQNIPAMAMNLTAREIERLAGHPMVEAIGRMEVYRTTSAESHPLATVDVAHVNGFLGEGVTVAIIDDAIDSDHRAFGREPGFPTSRIVGGFDFADFDPDPRNDCFTQSHGTAVAGIVAGNGVDILNNPMTGVAPQAKLVFVKIQSARICGQSLLDGDLVGAIDWVVTNKNTYGIGVLSMSLGAGAYSSVGECERSSPALTDVLNVAEAAGIVTFAASGNNGRCEQLSRPACIGSVISVGATYDADIGRREYCVSRDTCAPTGLNLFCELAGLATVVEETTSADQVTAYTNSAPFLDILAPSECALTAMAGSGGGSTPCFGGTSAATPFAAGTAALLLQAAGANALNRSQVLSALRHHGAPVTDGRMGRVTPRVDAWASIRAVRGAEEICEDGIDNDGDGDVDCDDADCAQSPGCAHAGDCLFSADFARGDEGFRFIDDPEDPRYVSGSARDGRVTVTLGGIDSASIFDMLGVWQRSCSLADTTAVEITVRADLAQTSPYETDEFSEARLTVNGVDTVLARITGDGNGGADQTTGLQTYTLSTVLAAGAHTIDLGCFNNQKTVADESTDCSFESIRIAAAGPPPPCTVDDDFETASADGWVNSSASTCSTGAFVLGTPTAVVNGGVTTQVDGANSGGNALFTATNRSAGVNDVDGGNCILLSPTFNVVNSSTLSIAYYHGQRDTGDDPGGDFFVLEVSTDGGASFAPIASNDDTAADATWNTTRASIPAGSEVQVRVQCSDGPSAGDLVECGIDDLSVCTPAARNILDTRGR